MAKQYNVDRRSPYASLESLIGTIGKVKQDDAMMLLNDLKEMQLHTEKERDSKKPMQRLYENLVEENFELNQSNERNNKIDRANRQARESKVQLKKFLEIQTRYWTLCDVLNGITNTLIHLGDLKDKYSGDFHDDERDDKKVVELEIEMKAIERQSNVVCEMIKKVSEPLQKVFDF